MLFLYFLIAVLAFLCGYYFAKAQNGKSKAKPKKENFAVGEKVFREFENFLNYDGTEQSQKGT